MKQIIYAPIIISLFAVFSVNAKPGGNTVRITTADLPLELQACVNSGDCAVDNASISTHDDTSMFNYTDLVTNTTSKLIRYSLTNSHQDNNGVVDDFSGHVWLKAADNYDSNEAVHDLSLYMDQVSPVPFDMSFDPNFNPDIIQLGLTSVDLLAGSGFAISVLDSSLPAGFFEDGALQSSWLPSPCLADGCGIGAIFNLVNLQYSTSGSMLSLIPSLNAADVRDVLYSQESYFNSGDPTDFFKEQVFAVQAVPLPAATWLFISGLIGLAGFLKRRNS